MLVVALGGAEAVRGDDTAKVQLSGGGSQKAKGKDKPTVSERPQVLSLTTVTSTDKPKRPETGDATAETAKLISQFQTAREQYLIAQKENSLKFKTATEEERVLLREKSQEALNKWREEYRSFVEEQKERAKLMKQELQPDLGQVLDNAGEGAGNGRGR